MDLHLNSDQTIRMSTHNYGVDRNFVDITCLNDELGLQISNWTTTKQYIEIRKKSNQIAMFVYSKKSDKHYAKLGWWEDSEVVFSINEVEHNK
jgi:hypothetical protein